MVYVCIIVDSSIFITFLTVLLSLRDKRGGEALKIN
jgi:hypothetical protein